MNDLNRYGLSPSFTLIELLTVIAIIGILAAIAAPVLNTFRPNVGATASQALLAAVARGRQLAISQRTTVYMVFVPTNFFRDPAIGGSWPPSWPATELAKATNLFDKQLLGYNYVSLRSLGDQPGRPTAHYLSSWKTLPDGAFIPWWKFGPRNRSFFTVTEFFTQGSPPTPASNSYQVFGFHWTNNIPFPSEQTPAGASSAGPYVTLPFIAFNYLGQLVDGQNNLAQTNEFIPLAKGSVSFARNASKVAQPQNPAFIEIPPGNSTSSFNVVNIDWLTGRARLEHQEIQIQ